METSQGTVAIFMAMNKAQAEFKPVPKGCHNTFLDASYADLTGVWENIRTVLAENGLSVIQGVRQLRIEGCPAMLSTRICHTSGEWIEDDGVPLIVEANSKGNLTMQSQGSAISYARRQGLSALLGVVTEEEDDDAAAASATLPDRNRPKGGTAAPKTKGMKGPVKTMTELKKICRATVADISACPDLEALDAFEGAKTTKALVDQLQLDWPEAYDSPRTDKNSFIGIRQSFEEARKSFEDGPDG